MSGIMLKTAVYGFVRFTFDFLGGGPWWSGYVVLVVAAVTGLLGILYAIAEDDLKRLLAYSSVENIGIIFLGMGPRSFFWPTGFCSARLWRLSLRSFTHSTMLFSRASCFSAPVRFRTQLILQI